jgi:secondary thiamine-phosphate synthase enzyme
MLIPAMVASITTHSNSEGAAPTIAQAFSVVLAVLTENPNRPKYKLIIFKSGGSSSTIRILPVGESILVLMRFYTEYLTFKTAKHREYINITPQVETALHKSAIQEGMILVSAMHITAGVWVNDAEDGLIADIDEWLEKLAPFRKDYRHHRTGETNGDSHLKSLLVHHEVIVPVTAGKLDFGPWQQVYYAEFDGQRSKRVIIKVMGE